MACSIDPWNPMDIIIKESSGEKHLHNQARDVKKELSKDANRALEMTAMGQLAAMAQCQDRGDTEKS